MGRNYARRVECVLFRSDGERDRQGWLLGVEGEHPCHPRHGALALDVRRPLDCEEFWLMLRNDRLHRETLLRQSGQPGTLSRNGGFCFVMSC